MAPDDDDFASMLAEFEKQNPEPKKREPKLGETVKGRVVSIGSDAVFIDLGAKAEGMIDVMQLRDANGKLLVAVGDTVEARVVETSTSGKAGCIVLHPLGTGHVARAELEQAFALGLPVEGVVAAVNKGGVEVTVAGVRAFCPISQLDLRHVEDAAAFVGSKLAFKITRYEPKNLVLSRRALLEEEQRRQATETRARLAPGAVLRGRVSALKDYGAFIDLGGLEGMVHVSELGFARVAHPKELLTVGQEVEVAVLRIEKGDDPKKPEKIALSIKSLERDPWDDAAERFTEGTRARGTVARVEQFGAFVELTPGVEGLAHISELGGGRRIQHAREAVKVGQVLEVVVSGVDRERRRISLSVAREDTADPGDAAAVPKAPEKLGTLADLLNKKKPKPKK